MLRASDSLPAVLPDEPPFDELAADEPAVDRDDTFEMIEADSSPPADALLMAPEWQARVSRSRGLHRKPVDPDFHALCAASIVLADLTTESRPHSSLHERRESGSALRAAAREVIRLGTDYIKGPSGAQSTDRLAKAYDLRDAALALVRKHLDADLQEAILSASGAALVNAYKSHAMYCLEFFKSQRLSSISDDLQVSRYGFLSLALDPSDPWQDPAPVACRALLRESLAQALREGTHAPDAPGCLAVFIPEYGHGLLSIHRDPRSEASPLTRQIAVMLKLVAPDWTSDGNPRSVHGGIVPSSMRASRLRPQLAEWLRTLDVDALHDRLRQERDRVADVVTAMRADPLPLAADPRVRGSLMSDARLRSVTDRLRRLKTLLTPGTVWLLPDLERAFFSTATAHPHVAPPASLASTPPSDQEDPVLSATVQEALAERDRRAFYKLFWKDSSDSLDATPPSSAEATALAVPMNSSQEHRP